MVGWSGLKRVEHWVRPDTGTHGKLADDDPAWQKAKWEACVLEPPPADWGGGLPDGVLPKEVWGFDATGKPKEWPLRFSVALCSVTFTGLEARAYEVPVRPLCPDG